jgi:hypothetical protein
LHEFYKRVDGIFRVAIENRRWWIDEVDATIQPPLFDDQKAVLGQLTSHEAGMVASYTHVVELVRTHRGLEMESHDAAELSGVTPASEDATAQLEAGRTAAQNAAKYLRRVADLPMSPPTIES